MDKKKKDFPENEERRKNRIGYAFRLCCRFLSRLFSPMDNRYPSLLSRFKTSARQKSVYIILTI